MLSSRSCGSGFDLILAVLLFAFVALVVAWILFAWVPAWTRLPSSDGMIYVLATLVACDWGQLRSVGLVDVICLCCVLPRSPSAELPRGFLTWL
jgi:hypothetical protein